MTENKGKSISELESRFNLRALLEFQKNATDAKAKKELMRESQFYAFLNNGSKRCNCLVLFMTIASCYDQRQEAFFIDGVWMTICVKEVAYLLGLKSNGNKAPKRKKSFVSEDFFDSLCSKYCSKDPRPINKIKQNNDPRLHKVNIQNMLRVMKIDTEEDKEHFRKLLRFYILSFIVYPNSTNNANMSNFALVRDSKTFEEINWAQVIHGQLVDSVKRFRDCTIDKKAMRYADCITPLLEAWFYMRTGIKDTAAKDSNRGEAAPISKFLGKVYPNKDDCKTFLENNSSKVVNCKHQPECEAQEKKLMLMQKPNEIILCDEDELLLEMKQDLQDLYGTSIDHAIKLELVTALAFGKHDNLKRVQPTAKQEEIFFTEGESRDDHLREPIPQSSGAIRSSIYAHAVQCETCLKWRTVSKQEFEEIRSKHTEEPFFCSNKPNVSCDDFADIEYDSSRTWAMDKSNLPKTPAGFQREVVLSEDFSKLDVHYVGPDGEKIRASTEILNLIEVHPEYKLSLLDFSFASLEVKKDCDGGTKKLKMASEDA